MGRHETGKEIEEAAAQWLAQLDRAPLSADESAQLERWLAGDARRRGAFLRARALWLRAGSPDVQARSHETEASAGHRPPARSESPRGDSRRRQLWNWSGAIAASLLLAVFLTVSAPMSTAYATAKGEMRRVPLADGSTLTLNTDSRVRVYEDGGRLRVKVERGEVFVEAAATGDRLTVEVDGRRFGAAAAAFVVRKLHGQPTQVVVQSGEVGVSATSARVAANTRVSLPPGRGEATPVPLSPDQLQREMAWRDGKLAFQGETLAEAAAMFSRYSDVRIVIADPQLAGAPVAGLFAANNPAGFGRAVAEVFDADVRQERGRIVLGRAH